ncbi:RNA polymerase sigma factor [Terrabacter sp. RAF57]|uniref:RNA polymerase sigma factor n=1 Tax=Terrabacter sp. RAF57 TaxID=3233063 RepID=UPI003F97FEF1
MKHQKPRRTRAPFVDVIVRTFATLTGVRTDDEAGEEQRFCRLYRQHYAAIHGFAYRRLHDRGAAADATAEVFLVAWRRIDEIPAVELGWLFGVAHRVVLTANRSAPLLTVTLDDADPTSGAGDLTVRYEHFEELRRVASAVNRLSPTDRQVLLLVAWEELTGAELAAALGCSRGAAAVRLHRARTRLKRELESPTPTKEWASVTSLKGQEE